MKTAIYIEDGTIQLVLTPESEFEKSTVNSFREKLLSVQIFSGEFYDCRGGWVRQKAYYAPYGDSPSNNTSLILRVSEPKQQGE